MDDAAPPPGLHAIAFGDFLLVPQSRQLLLRGQPLRLGARAFDLLHELVRRPGEVVGKGELIARVWPDVVVEEGSLRMHVAALRKLLSAADAGVEHIQNVPLRGYCFVAAVTRVVPSAMPPPEPPAAAGGGRLARHNLPAPVSELVGRETAVARLCRDLEVARCVTVVGPAGIGKSLVGLAAARDLLERFDGAVWHLDFASVAESAHVPSALAMLLAVPTLAGDPVSDVMALLGTKRVLLVFDNCEHIVDAVAAMAERLIGRTAGIRLVCTSREPLRIAGERIQRLLPLELPPPDSCPDAASALAWPAVRLLVARAAAAVDGFVFRDTDVEAAVQVCQRLDGLPLAIELVAMRTTSFGLRGLADRLDDHMMLVTPGRRTALPRQRTLQAALDWSEQLLSDRERRLLHRLSVFRGRFTLDDAQAVAGDAGDAPSAIGEALAGLAAKSLVEVSIGDPLPYRLLRTTRSHAAERLADCGDAPQTRLCHARHWLQLLGDAEARIETMDSDAWRALHAPRVDDLRAALDLCFADAQTRELACELVAAAAPFWFHLGLVRECLDRVEQVGALDDPDRQPLRAMRLSLAHGHAALHIEGAGLRSETSLSRSLALATRLDRTHDRLCALWGLFIERMMRGDHLEARRVGDEFCDVSQRVDDPQVAATCARLQALALHLCGEHGAARKQAERALRSRASAIRFLHGSAYHVDHESSTLAPLARVMWLLGEPEQARELAQLAVARAARLDHGFSLTYALALAAIPIALWSGDVEGAAAHHDQLRHCTLRHSLVFWQGWSATYAGVLDWLKDPDSDRLEWLDAASRVPGRADMLATFGEALVTPLAMSRSAQGRNAWCAPEILRAAAMRAWRRGDADLSATRDAVGESLRMAQRQQAVGWAGRCAASLAELAISGS